MKILIVDDEPLARQRLARFLENLPSVSQVWEAVNGLDAIDQVNRHVPDLLLLDIRMPGLGGLEVAAHLSQMNEPPAIIFCTAFEEHALEAIRVQAIDYLLKPVRLIDLEKAIQKASKINKLQAASLMAAENPGVNRTHLSINSHRGLELLALDDIYFCKAEQKYVQVKTQEHEYLLDESLKQLEEEFDYYFIRIHRNALVAKKYVSRVSKDSKGQAFIWLQGVEEPLEISRRHLSLVRKALKDTL